MLQKITVAIFMLQICCFAHSKSFHPGLSGRQSSTHHRGLARESPLRASVAPEGQLMKERQTEGETTETVEIVKTSARMSMTGSGMLSTNTKIVQSSSLSIVQKPPPDNTPDPAVQKLELTDIKVEEAVIQDEGDTVGDQVFKEEEVAEEKEEVVEVVGEDLPKIEAALVETGEPNTTPEDKANIKEEAEEIMKEEEVQDTSLTIRQTPIETEVTFEGFDEVCKKEIFTADKFLVSFIVKEHIDQNGVMNSEALSSIAAKIQVHAQTMKTYEGFLLETKGLVDALYAQYVPTRVLKLVRLFETELEITPACTVTPFSFADLKGPEVTAKKATIEPRMKVYLKEWEDTSLDMESYRPLATNFYNEMSILMDADRRKQIDEHTKFTPAVKTLDSGSASYDKRLKEVNSCICPVLKRIVYAFAGEASMKSKFESKFGSIADHTDLKKADFREYSIELFDSFSDTVNKFWPEKCGDSTRTIQEMIFFARTAKFIKDFPKLQVSVNSPDGVWGAFFNMFEELQMEKYRQVINYDMYLLQPRSTSKELFETMVQYRTSEVVFHPAFFNLMSDFPTFFAKPVMGKNRMSLVELRTYFETAEMALSTADFKEDAVHGFNFMRDVWSAIYKIYVFQRSQGALTNASTLADVFEKICGFLHDKTFFDSDPNIIYTELFQQGSFSILYPHLLSYIDMLSLSPDVNGKACVKADVFPLIVKTVPPKDPLKYTRVTIHKTIVDFFTKFQIDKIMQGFKEAFIAIGWNVAKCPEGKQKDFDYEKAKTSTRTVIKKSLKKGDEKLFGGAKVLTERKVSRYTKDCVTEFIPKLETVMTTKGFAEFKKANIKKMHKEIIRIVMEVIEESAYEVRGLIYHVLLRWMLRENKDIAKIDADKKMFIFLMFEVVESRVLRMINYYESAGFYGFLMRVVTESGFPGNTLKYKHVNEEWAKFDVLMDIETIDRDMLRTDMFYLIEQAILMTNARDGDENQKIYYTDARNALNMLHALFERVRSKAEKAKMVKPWHMYQNFFQNVLNCRWNKFVLRRTVTLKNVDNVDQKTCGPGNLDCDFAENDFSQCNIEFALRQIGYLHRMPIFLYGLPAYDTHNYLHKYFVHSHKTEHPMDKRFLARLYRHYQNIRASSEAQVSDVVHFTLDRTIECMSNTSPYAAGKVDPKRFCIFSSRSYAEMYWVLKYQFAVNYRNVVFDLSSPPDMPLFGTSILMLNVFTFPEYKSEFKDTCEAIQEQEPNVDVCRVHEIVEKFLALATVTEDAPNSETTFTEIRAVLESWGNPVQTINGLFIVLEAMFVLENLDDNYQAGADHAMDMLNYRHFKSALETDRLKAQGMVFEDFLVDKTNKDAVKLMGDYLYFNYAKRKVLDIELALRSELAAVGPNDALFDDLTTYEGYRTTFIFKLYMLYSPDVAFSSAIALKLIDLKLFFAAATMEISNDWILQEINDYKAKCASGNKLKCFYNLMLDYQVVDDLKERAEEFNEVAKESDMNKAGGEDELDFSDELLDDLTKEETIEVAMEEKDIKVIGEKSIAIQTQTIATFEETVIVTDVAYTEDITLDGSNQIAENKSGDEVFLTCKLGVVTDFDEGSTEQVMTDSSMEEDLTDASPTKESEILQEEVKEIATLPTEEKAEEERELQTGTLTEEVVEEELKQTFEEHDENQIQETAIIAIEKKDGLDTSGLNELSTEKRTLIGV